MKLSLEAMSAVTSRVVTLQPARRPSCTMCSSSIIQQGYTLEMYLLTHSLKLISIQGITAQITNPKHNSSLFSLFAAPQHRWG
jgi:hypothetical protein